ncbi:HdeD family acid-resistance protein [Puniceicoccus vermicola]|uniref:HdeD family acid-resistance protein n=1 Tax=Puniceicoccus vermicola TaxID=388746 RepID=A0A7X1AXJ3_9BACT|nr:HdeD family acid-resistance protein [Puniceicoccus vermicola]MBC2601841.1 HdeD family acid-resistance protein [Puniceicoccus vermicola]
MSQNPVPSPFLNVSPEILQRHAKSAKIAGIVCILIGIAAMAIPGVFTLGIEIFIGSLLLVAGLTQVFAAVGSIGSRHWFLALLTGILTTAVGILFLTNPLKGIITLTALLGIFFLASGIVRLIYSFQLSGKGSAGVSIFNAIVTIILGALVLSGWPESSPVILGIFLGIDLIFFGLFLLTYSSACKRFSEEKGRPPESL